ncbi:MAG: trehalose-phosphatase [Geminicoccaceae bacterium]|nr:trehalose-phosphatase [Geminicoccaceae bacterium]
MADGSAASGTLGGSVASGTLEDAFGRLDDLAADAAAGRLALFLDFDGTLAPIVDRPGDARMSDELRGCLQALARRMPVAVVSGRDLDDVARRVALDGIAYAGSHGYCMRHADGREEEQGREFLGDLDAAERALHAAFDGAGDVVVERKRFAIAVHYRRSPVDPNLLERRVRACLSGVLSAPERLEMHGGKMIFEVRPRFDWHKGRAVMHLLACTGGRAPLFIGDDVTDEQAFRTLREEGPPGSVGIVVDHDDRPTWATLRLDDVAAVERFLVAFSARL